MSDECQRCDKPYCEGECFRKEPNVNPENYKSFHYCEVPEHSHIYGLAIDDCFEDVDGYLFVSNGEYGSQVNFCPMCGYEGKKKIVASGFAPNVENDKSFDAPE